MLDDFQVDNENEDKLQGDEDYMEETVDAKEFVNPNDADEDEVEAESTEREVSLEELAEKELEDDNYD